MLPVDANIRKPLGSRGGHEKHVFVMQRAESHDDHQPHELPQLLINTYIHIICVSIHI